MIDKEFIIDNNNMINLFQFEFTSINNKPHKNNKVYTVYSYTREDMEIFLQQHSFKLENSYIKYVCISSRHSFEDILCKYKFKSNNNKNEVYTIMTTANIVTESVTAIGSELSASLMFGSTSLRGDIEVFETISNLIDDMPYVFIVDQMISDDNSIIDRYEFDEDKFICDGCDDEGLYESLLCASATEDIQPITIEAYVECFASMLIK